MDVNQQTFGIRCCGGFFSRLTIGFLKHCRAFISLLLKVCEEKQRARPQSNEYLRC